jgi:hypothetical protein
MHAAVGDRIRVSGTRVNDAVREGEVIEVRGEDGEPPFVVRWANDGHESFFCPGPTTHVEHTQEGRPDEAAPPRH